MLHLLKRQSPHFEFSQNMLALPLTLPAKNLDSFENSMVKIFFPNQQLLPFVSHTDKLLIPSRKRITD